MASPLRLAFDITADPSGADAALKLLQRDMAAMSAETQRVGRSLGLLPSATAQLIKNFNALATEEERAAFALKNFGDAGLKAIPALERLRTQMAEVDARAAQLQKGMGGATQAIKNFTDQAIDPLYSALGPLGGALRSLTTGLGPVGVGVGALVAGLAAAAVSAGNYARSIERAAIATGLDTDAIQALTAALSSVGGSQADVLDLIGQFSQNIQGARTDNVEAAASFRKLGVDVGNAGLTMRQALDQTFKSLAQMPAGFERATTEQRLWGEEGSRQLGQLRKLTAEGVDPLINKYKELGRVMGKDTVEQAAKFDKAIDDIETSTKAHVAGGGAQFISWLEEVRGLLDVSGLVEQFKRTFIKRPDFAAETEKAQKAEREAQDRFIAEQNRRMREGGAGRIETAEEKKAREEREKAAKKAAEDAAREAERLAKQLAADRRTLAKAEIAGSLELAEQRYAKEKALLEAALKDELITVTSFTDRMIAQEARLGDARRQAAREARAVDVQAQETAVGKLAVSQEALNKATAVSAEEKAKIQALEAEAPRLLAAQSEKIADQTKELERHTAALTRDIEEFNKQTQAQLKAQLEGGAQVAVSPIADFFQPSQMQQLRLSLAEAASAVSPFVVAWQDAKTGVSDFLTTSAQQFGGWGQFVSNTFSQVTGSIEQMLGAFILTGKGGAQAFRQLAAAIIAGLAVQSGVQALMEVARGMSEIALGKAALAFAVWPVPNPAAAAAAGAHFAAAGAHFASAKAFGIIGGGAAVAGIAIGAAGGLGGGGGGGGEFGGGGEQAPGEVFIGGSPTSIGRRRDELMMETLDATTQVLSRLSSAPAGEVAVWMGEQAPVVFTNAAAEGAARDSGAGRLLLANAGVGN